MYVEILADLESHINTLNPGSFDKSFSGVYFQGEEGKVIYRDDLGNYEYQGISDTYGQYFYIRKAGPIQFFDIAEDDRLTACDNRGAAFEARLVVNYRGGVISTIIEALSRDILAYCGTTDSYSNVRAALTEVDDDYERIYQEETGKDEVMIPGKGWALIAFDITIGFVITGRDATIDADCINRDFCQPC